MNQFDKYIFWHSVKQGAFLYEKIYVCGGCGVAMPHSLLVFVLLYVLLYGIGLPWGANGYAQKGKWICPKGQMVKFRAFSAVFQKWT